MEIDLQVAHATWLGLVWGVIKIDDIRVVPRRIKERL